MHCGFRISDFGLKSPPPSVRRTGRGLHPDLPPASGLQHGEFGVARAVPDPQSAICNPKSNRLDLANLTERFQTRFQSIRLQPPANEALAQFLARRWGAPIRITRRIADGARGNVRAAMADLEVWMG